MFSLCVTLMFSVRSEIVITGVGMNSLCNFTKYYSCEISLNVNFKRLSSTMANATPPSGYHSKTAEYRYFEKIGKSNLRLAARYRVKHCSSFS